MNYCLINEAWDNKITTNYDDYMIKNTYDINNTNTAIIANNTNNTNNTIESYNENTNDICFNTINHIRNCKKCQSDIQIYHKKIVKEEIINFILNNKDTIIIILIIIIVLLSIDLLKK